jgi:ribosomal protein S18 acetylase RimI-like enzyme
MAETTRLIRPASLSDLDVVRRCAEEAYALYVDRIGRKPAPMVAEFVPQIEAGHVHVCVGTDGVLGYIVFYPRDDHIHIENVAIFPTHQGSGLGRLLIGYVESEARSANLKAIELYTNQMMTENLRFYPRLGYREMGRGEEGGFARVFYRKDLG